MVLLVRVNNLQFAIPFRTNVIHKYCYKFKNTTRDTSTSTAIDFSKTVVIKNEDYLSNFAKIDNEEFKELNDKYYFIIKKFTKYVNDYIKIITTYSSDSYEYKSMKYSTLQYFHHELKIK